MKKVIYVLLLAIISAPILRAQIAKTTIPIEQVSRSVMPKQDNEYLKSKELERRSKELVPEFAVPLEVAIDPSNEGTWETLPDDSKVWRIRIYSAGASSINLGFSKFRLPEGSQMYLYSIHQSHIQGPFSTVDNETHNEFWSPIIFGEEIVVELQLPVTPDKYELEIAKVNHDFMGFETASQGCNIDVNCGIADGFPEIEAYRDVIQSVAMFSLNGTQLCTGFLVNNARQDCTPYFVTGQHCGINAQSASSMVVYWNYENSRCRPINTAENRATGDGLLDVFNSGAIFRAEYQVADMELVELDDPVNPKANAYFAGWNVAPTPPATSVCIHHPNTEEKRISFATAPSYLGNWFTDDLAVENGNHIIIPFWDAGTTERGSSGAPLFNERNQVVGQLHGGLASCNNQEFDSFGRWTTAWTGGGTRSSSLQEWLDPDGIGLTEINGKWEADCGKSILADTYTQIVCPTDTARFQFELEGFVEDSVRFAVEGLPNSLDLSFQQGSSSVEFIIAGLENSSNTDLIFSVQAEDSSGFGTAFFKLVVLQNTATPVELLTPLNNDLAVSLPTNLVWMPNGNLNNYQLQLATDENFETILIDTFLSNRSDFNLAELSSETGYYWRVRVNNRCATGAWSTVNSFNLASCATYVARDLPKTIAAANPNQVNSIINITSSGAVSSINVQKVKGLHSWISDLSFVLESPVGTEVVLLNRICEFEENFDLGFSDNSLLTNFPCPPLDGQSYQPAQPLGRFNNEPVTGEWTLTVTDNEPQDGGALTEWSIEVCQIDEALFDIGVTAELDTLYCDVGEVTTIVEFGEAFTADNVEIELLDAPPLVLINTAPNPSNANSRLVTFQNINRLPPNTYSVTLNVSDDIVVNTLTLPITVGRTPEEINLLNPANEELIDPIESNFEWTTSRSSEVDTFIFELSLTEDFALAEQNFTTMTSFRMQDTLLQDTTYYWRVRANNECGERLSATRAFQTNSIVSTVNILPADFAAVYPNPNNGEFLVEFSRIEQLPVRVQILDLMGRVLSSDLQSNLSAPYDLSNFGKGIYVLLLTTEQGIWTNKIVVE